MGNFIEGNLTAEEVKNKLLLAIGSEGNTARQLATMKRHIN
jgi:hypothetical protein